MLQLTGKCLGIKSETVGSGMDSFQSTTIHVLVQGDRPKVEDVRIAREFPPADLPKDGEDVTLEVSVSAFAFKRGGAGYSLTALRRVGARRAPVSAAS